MSMTSLGVSTGDEQVYRLMLRRPDATAADPEAIERLIGLGLLRRETDGSVRAADPHAAIERLIQRRLATIHGELNRVAAARSALPSLLAEQTATQPVELVERLEGRERAQRRIWEATERMGECLTMVPQRRGVDETVRQRTLRRLAQGVVYRSIVHRDVLRDHRVDEYMREIHRAGDHHRVTGEPIQPLTIVDRATAFVAIEPGDPGRGALMIRQPGIVATLVDLFEHAWERAVDLVPGGPAPTAEERQVLDMLNRFAKDETAARAMGVSVRTFRSRVAMLMAGLGAANRFQIGVRARERGWIQ